MKQHTVPQNIMSVEFKIIGDLTIRQFIYVSITGGLAFIFYLTFLPGVLKFTLIILSILIGILVTFAKINERPFDEWINSFITAIMLPTQRVWKKSSAVPDYLIERPVTSPQQVAGKDGGYNKVVSYIHARSLPTDDTFKSNTKMDIEEIKQLTSIDKLLSQTMVKKPSISDATMLDNLAKSTPAPSQNAVNDVQLSSAQSNGVATARKDDNDMNLFGRGQQTLQDQSAGDTAPVPPLQSSQSSMPVTNVAPPASKPFDPTVLPNIPVSPVSNPQLPVTDQILPDEVKKPKNENIFTIEPNTVVKLDDLKGLSTSTLDTIDAELKSLQNSTPVGPPAAAPEEKEFIPETSAMSMPSAPVIPVDDQVIVPASIPNPAAPVMPVQGTPVQNSLPQDIPIQILPDEILPLSKTLHAEEAPEAVAEQPVLEKMTMPTEDSLTDLIPNAQSSEVKPATLPGLEDITLISEPVGEVPEKEMVSRENLYKEGLSESADLEIPEGPLVELGDSMNLADSAKPVFPAENVSLPEEPKPQETIIPEPVGEIEPVPETPLSENVNQDEVNKLVEENRKLKEELTYIQQKEDEPTLEETIANKQKVFGHMPDFVKLPNVISGVVVDSDEKLIEDVVVIIKDKTKRIMRAMRTNLLGQFYSRNPLFDGEYDVEANKEGFVFENMRITLNGKPLDPVLIRPRKFVSGEDNANINFLNKE